MEKVKSLLNLKNIVLKRPFFSVIVTTYKDENYIEECLASLLKQGLSKDDMELVITNDASPDGTVNLVKKFLSTHKDIDAKLLINGTNKGVSYSRNNAMKHARGENIVFLDGDDFLETNGLKNAKQIMKENNADLLIPRIDKFYEPDVDKKDIENPNTKEYNVDLLNKQKGENFFLNLRREGIRLCMPIVKKEIIERNKIIFENTLCEDDMFSLKTYMGSRNPKYYNGVQGKYYHYRKKRAEFARSRQNKKGIVEMKLKLSIDVLRMQRQYPNHKNLLRNFSTGYVAYANDFMKKFNIIDNIKIQNDFDKNICEAKNVPYSKLHLIKVCADNLLNRKSAVFIGMLTSLQNLSVHNSLTSL